jgi:poly(3-hydroxybutyrate) depolymerase
MMRSAPPAPGPAARPASGAGPRPPRASGLGGRLALALGLAWLLALPAAADEAAILANLKSFFATADPDRRAALASRIEADPAYSRRRVQEWLHRLDLYRLPAAPARSVAAVAGPARLRVAVGFGQQREVALRLPRGYDPGRPWPLIYALHPSGGSGPGFIGSVERLLGDRIEGFVVAAPTAYHQTSLDAPPPFTADHLAILRAVRQAVHVDSDRVYALGYSLGGYAAWAVACLHSDQLAGAVALSSAFSVPPGDDGLWRTMLPNLAHLPVLNVWGSEDTLAVLGTRTLEPVGGIAEMNRRLVEGTRGMSLPLRNVELPGRGHGGVEPPRAALAALLAARREHAPAAVEHNFRHLHQGHAYWLEAGSWQGGHWGSEPPAYARRPGESDDQAFGRAAGELLGSLSGEIAGQTLAVERRHVGDLTVWIGDGMIDWGKDVTVKVGGRQVFSGRLRPDLLVCLTQAARTFDFDRLRWAGVRVDARLAATPVTGRTAFPALVPEEAR